MQIQTRAQITINAPIEQVFDASIECQNLPLFFTGYQAIPAIVSAKTGDGQPLHEGSLRLVTNRDGSVIEEIITTLNRPTVQEYQLIRGFKPPFAWLVRSASGTWEYTTLGTHTQVTWTFVFETPHIVADLVFRGLVQRPFQHAQAICLGNIKTFIENDSKATPAPRPPLN